MILVLDNYDSFTYNLVQYLGILGATPHVLRNDQGTLKQIEALEPTHIVVSPGPGIPQDAGISVDLIKHFGPQTPILGVCLGHQAIGVAYGAKVRRCDILMHGKTSWITHDDKTIYRDLANPFIATRYHSLIIDEETLPEELEVTSRDDWGVIMGVRHRSYQVEGVQFHPESILTELGMDLLRNFVAQGGE